MRYKRYKRSFNGKIRDVVEEIMALDEGIDRCALVAVGRVWCEHRCSKREKWALFRT